MNFHEIDIAFSDLRFQVAIQTWLRHRHLRAQNGLSAASYQSLKRFEALPVRDPMMPPRQLPEGTETRVNCLWKDAASAKYLPVVLEYGSVGRSVIKFE